MAGFRLELPKEVMDSVESLYKNKDKMLEEMTRKGAEVVYKNIMANMKRSFKSTKSLESGLRITKSYKTKSDDAVNTKVGFYGYNEKGVAIPLIALAREYGTSRGEAKKPFIRKSFNANEITDAMLKVEREYIEDE